MSVTEKGTRVVMVRWSLENIPRYELPPGFSIREYEPADEENWFRIEAAADQFNEITRELFEREFGSDKRVLVQRQCYLVDGSGNAIGTGTAWFNDNFQGEKYGRVHWVGIVPEYQGRGLGKALLTTICERLSELGHERAYLTTESVRLPAIGLYLRFGFEPLIQNEAEHRAWQSVLGKLK